MDRFHAMLTFIRVVETGSFSAAARLLKLGQPAVSKAVAQLEQHLQARLLLRSTHGITPTEAGLRFYERARIAVDEADEAERAARDASVGLTGRLRVSAATTFARLHVVPHLAGFLERHPELAVEMVLDDRPIDLLAEGVDLSLRMGALPDSSLVARKLATGRRAVIATPQYLAQAGRPLVPADLLRHETIVHSQLVNDWRFHRAGTEVSVVPRGRLQISAAEGIRAAILAHLGLTIASEWMFAPELSDGTAVRLLDEWSLPDIDLWAVFPTGRLATAKARAFADFVASVVAV